MPLPAEIFKAYDIRGIVGKTLTPEIAERIGARHRHPRLARCEQKAVCIGRDGRLSGPALSAALARGLQAARHRRDRRRLCRDADALLRRATTCRPAPA